MRPVKILVTGSTGFVGRALVDRLRSEGRFSVRAAVRHVPVHELASRDCCVVGDINGGTDWSRALEGIDTVVHLAARAHVVKDGCADPLAEYRRINAEGTRNLARQAVLAGVRRFVFISSIKVNGEGAVSAALESTPYRESDTPVPDSPYGLSKFEAESALRAEAGNANLQWVIIRPPLVHGPGVRANFLALTRLVAHGIPLPLAAVNSNKRSMVSLSNLVDFIVTCAEHPSAAGEVFFVSDGEDLSTADLIRRLARAMGLRARLIPVPVAVLRGGAMALGLRDLAQRLLGSLQVDISKARQRLGWAPPMGVDEGLKQAVACARNAE